MLVLARARSEAIVIDGVIRIEVVGLTKGTAQVRFSTPRHLRVTRGAAPTATPVARPDADVVGMEQIDLPLSDHQVVTVGDSIHVGIVDVNASRALLFVDAPHGTRVTAKTTPAAGPTRGKSARPKRAKPDRADVNWLPFPSPTSSEADSGAPDQETAPDDCERNVIPLKSEVS